VAVRYCGIIDGMKSRLEGRKKSVVLVFGDFELNRGGCGFQTAYCGFKCTGSRIPILSSGNLGTAECSRLEEECTKRE